ncbi:hypothetical protein C8D70_1073 [Chryseobacterium sp. CBTAP 102]|uniref:hypothetical protein n=1 Tax=Chryseobacterium sp. CBTAP 102 TaxID=2135644 RepID=UPI000D98DB88|nr:hypothetical protein [Chryseobacterium sp. CBTAP 102]PXW14301.1 hypothetical protein C8D70_1073 [Chryseobacterium sp. CBTAP 102]
MIKYVLLIFVCLMSCKDVKENSFQKVEYKDFSFNIYKKYHKNYFVDSSNVDPLNFVKIYTEYCKIDCREDDYYLEKEVNLFNDKKDNVFYCELVRFKNSIKMNYVIEQIKIKNCIDPYNIKINKIYELDPRSAIFVNYSNFNVDDFQTSILSKYGKYKIVDVNEH